MLEYIVRPYQSPDPFGRPQRTTPVGTRQRATLTWGAKATMPTVSAGINIACCKEGLGEQKRNSAIIRVSNPDDDSQYVDVARPVDVALHKKDSNSCASDWDQFSGVGAEISAALDEFTADMSTGTAAGSNIPAQCSVTWNLDTSLRSNEQFLRYEQSTTSQSGL